MKKGKRVVKKEPKVRLTIEEKEKKKGRRNTQKASFTNCLLLISL